MRKILILGHARHGKDTVAEYLSLKLCVPYDSSSKALAPEVRQRLISRGIIYDSNELCWIDRHIHRSSWHEIIADMCKDNKAAVADEVYSNCSIYNGIRAQDECDAVIAKYDPIVIWVDAGLRKPLEATMHVVPKDDWNRLDNNYNKEYLFEQLDRLAEKLLQNYRLGLAKAEATLSDLESKVGCVIMDKHCVVGKGHNRKEEDLANVMHAELYAIKAATSHVAGCSMAITRAPCTACAIQIANAGIIEASFPPLDESSSWLGSQVIGMKTLAEAGVKINIIGALK